MRIIPWSPEETDYLQSISKAKCFFSARAAAAMLSKRFGKVFTRNAVLGKRYRLARGR